MGILSPDPEDDEGEGKEALDDQGSDWEPLQSSHVAAKRYDAQTGTLYVLFHDGAVWAYSSVPPMVNEQFTTASSPGQFMARVIKPSYSGSREF